MVKKGTVLLMAVVLFVGSYAGTVFAAQTNRTIWEETDNPITISEDGLTVNLSGSSRNATASQGKSSGKWYWEVKLNSRDSRGDTGSAGVVELNNNTVYTYRYSGNIYKYPSVIGSTPAIGVGSVLGFALDLEDMTLDFYRNGALVYTADISDLAGETIYPQLRHGNNPGNYYPTNWTANFGPSGFVYEVPEGFLPYDYEAVDETTEDLFVLLAVSDLAQLSLTHRLPDNLDYIWTSNDTDVVTVDSDGIVTAVGAGETNVVCTSTDGAYSDFVPFKVLGEQEIQLALHLVVGESKMLWITDDVANVTWQSSDPLIVQVDQDGEVTGLSRGIAIVQGEYNGNVYSIYVRVNTI